MTLQLQAEDFFNASKVLRESNQALFDRSDNSSGDVLKGTKVFGKLPTMGVEIVCLAFSVELYIKDVHYAIEGKAPRGHKILKLFEDLPEKTQQEIFTHRSIIERGWNFEEFKREIKAISDGFEKWRYAHEVTTLRYNNYFALIFIEALQSAASTARKRSTVKHD